MGSSKSSQRAGFLLISSFLSISVLLSVSLAVYSYNFSFFNVTERTANRIIAFNVAEAGFSDALVKLKDGQIIDFPWESGYVSMNTGSIQGGYRAVVTDMGSGVYEIAATGYAPGEVPTLRAYESRAVTGYVGVSGGGLFDFAIFAKDSLNFDSNAVTDSYNSSVGSYDGNNPGSNGDIGTDSIGTSTVRLDSNAVINGDAVVGPAGNPNVVISTDSNSYITGTRSPASYPKNYQPKTTDIPSEGPFSLDGNTNHYLPAGQHRFDSFSMNSNSTLTAGGPVEIYVDGPLTMDSNSQIYAAGDIPGNFLVFITGSHLVRLDSNTDFYGAIYAPASDVRKDSNAELFGTIVAKTYDQNSNARVHYDEALSDLSSGSGSLEVLSWQEENLTVSG